MIDNKQRLISFKFKSLYDTISEVNAFIKPLTVGYKNGTKSAINVYTKLM